MKRIIYELYQYLLNSFVASVPFWCVRRFFLRVVMGKDGIGVGSVVNMHCFIWSPSRLRIGEYSHVNRGCTLDCRGSIVIGNSVSISHHVAIFTASHDLMSREFTYFDGKVTIEDYAWIGANCTILGAHGLTIGKGAVVAAGAVVTKDVPPFSIVAGVPAKVIGERNHNLSYKCCWPYHFI